MSVGGGFGRYKCGCVCISSVEFPTEVNFHTVDYLFIYLFIFFFFFTKFAVCLGRYPNKEQKS